MPNTSFPRPLAKAVACGLLWACAGACGGDAADDGSSAQSNASADYGGSVVVTISTEPGTLLPSLVKNDYEQAITEVLYDRLADIGPDLGTVGDAGFTPRLASSWQWSTDSLSLAFTLDARARWHDGEPVTSEDVQRSFVLYTDPRAASPSAALLANIDSVTTPDAQTATFWFKTRSPLQFYDATFHMFVMPAHLLRDADLEQLALAPVARTPVGTGRFRFVEWVPGSRLEIAADTANYRGRAHLDRVIYTPVTEAGAAIAQLRTGEVDFASPLQPDNIEQLADVPGVRVVRYSSLGYQHLAFNLRARGDSTRPHPVLGDPAVRRALSMATDRERIIQSVFDSLGEVAVGPAPRRLFPGWAGLRGIPYDVAGARVLLDSAGWLATGAEGLRERNGVPLAIEILVPSISVTRDRVAVLLQDQLRAIGADVTLQRLEVKALGGRLEAGRFDSYTGAWITSPGLVGLRQVWATPAAGETAGEYGHYRNPTFDRNVDTFLTTFDTATATRTLTRALQTILDDAPAIWLVEMMSAAGMSARIEPGALPVTGWWHGLPDWTIPAARRIDRDRIGLPTPN
jgi:peptide/nickel transport system substrate-binding protein